LGWLSAQTPPGTHKEKKEKNLTCLGWIAAQMPPGWYSQEKKKKKRIKKKKKNTRISVADRSRVRWATYNTINIFTQLSLLHKDLYSTLTTTYYRRRARDNSFICTRGRCSRDICGLHFQSLGTDIALSGAFMFM
jgi:hypothetical protein